MDDVEREITRSRILKVAVGLFITFICFLIALWGVDFQQITHSFSRANYFTLPVLFALLFLFFWLKALRWKLLLKPLREFRTREVVGPLNRSSPGKKRVFD